MAQPKTKAKSDDTPFAHVNWPTAVIIIALIGTLATLFGPLIGTSDAPEDVKSIEKIVLEFKDYSTKQFILLRTERRDDMKIIRAELSAIKENVLQNARDVPKGRSTGNSKRTSRGYVIDK